MLRLAIETGQWELAALCVLLGAMVAAEGAQGLALSPRISATKDHVDEQK